MTGKNKCIATASAIIFTLLPVAVIFLSLVKEPKPQHAYSAPQVLLEVPDQGTLNVTLLDAGQYCILTRAFMPCAYNVQKASLLVSCCHRIIFISTGCSLLAMFCLLGIRQFCNSIGHENRNYETHKILTNRITAFSDIREAEQPQIFCLLTAGIQIVEALNIPFALPPLGPLRFKPPQPNPNGRSGTQGFGEAG